MIRAFRFRAGVAALLIFSGVSSVPAELQVPAYTAYLSPDVRGARVSEKNGITRWGEAGLEVLWFGELRSTGVVQCAVRLQPPEQGEAKLRLSVAGQAREATAPAGAEPVTINFGEFGIHSTGYHRFVLQSLNGRGKPAGAIQELILNGPASENAHFNLKPRRNAASVHLAYAETRPMTNVEAFYCEIRAVDDPLWTFYMACGWHRGYFGMQVISPTERRIIFSVWDSGSEAVDRAKVADENRVTLVAKGEGVYSGDFGNEGTGGHSHLKYLWRTPELQRFMVTARPVSATQTIYSGFYYHPEKREWMLISSWKAPKEGGYMRGLHSFSENFVGDNGHLRRKALFGNQWARTSDGVWHEVRTATFSHDPTGKADRLDRFMGVEHGQFFLSHGGFVPGFTPFGERFVRPPTAKPPEDLKLPELPE